MFKFVSSRMYRILLRCVVCFSHIIITLTVRKYRRIGWFFGFKVLIKRFKFSVSFGYKLVAYFIGLDMPYVMKRNSIEWIVMEYENHD